jgi:hypothetical protein
LLAEALGSACLALKARTTGAAATIVAADLPAAKRFAIFDTKPIGVADLVQWAGAAGSSTTVGAAFDVAALGNAAVDA